MTTQYEPGYERFFSGANGNNAEANYSAYLQSLSPDQLINRYKNADQSDYGVQGGILGTEDAQNYQAYQQFKQLVGRDPTSNEFATVLPNFRGPNWTDTGRAYIAQFAKQQENTPEALKGKAGQYSGDVNSMFQDLLKRGASKDELDYFGRALASGQTTPYQLSQYVQSLPEYQGQQDTQFRQGLQGELGKYDSEAFNREKENILGSYQKAGLGNSSALDFAITDALSKMQTNRDQFLGTLSASQYGGNKAAALDTYKQGQNQYLGNMDYQRNLNQSNLDQLTQRANQGQDYQTQMRDYLNYLNNQPKRGNPNALGGAIGGLLGAGVGGYLGGPQGAGAGYQVGSGFGYLM